MRKILMYLGFTLLGSIITISSAFALTTAKRFSDVDNNGYYATALERMVNRGVISGYQNGKFGPNDFVTRAQLVTALNKYDQEVGYMKSIVCSGINKESVSGLKIDNELVYDKLCKTLVE